MSKAECTRHLPCCRPSPSLSAEQRSVSRQMLKRFFGSVWVSSSRRTGNEVIVFVCARHVLPLGRSSASVVSPGHDKTELHHPLGDRFKFGYYVTLDGGEGFFVFTCSHLPRRTGGRRRYLQILRLQTASASVYDRNQSMGEVF